MKFQFYFLLFLFFSLKFSAFSQSCYISKTEQSGFDISAFQSTLNSNACELAAKLPPPFNNDFKVIEFGYYLHNSTMRRAIEANWTSIKTEVEQTYSSYLLIGKEVNSDKFYSRFIVELKLPMSGDFTCITPNKLLSIQEQVALAINDKFNSLGNSPFAYAEAEIAGMKKLGDIIQKYTECCLCCPSLRSASPCDVCEYVDKSKEDFAEKNPAVMAKIANFISAENCSEEAKDFAAFVIKLLEEDPLYKWERFEEMYNLLKNDPYALLNLCKDGAPDYSPWQELLNFRPAVGGPVRTRLQEIGRSIQFIDEASSIGVNLDEFSVCIKKLPSIKGRPFSSGKEFYDFFRTRLNEIFGYEFSYFSEFDHDKWQSPNPLTAFFEINLGLNGLIDGDVICSFSEECCWVFTTVKSPTFEGGFHPVSGNRQFGYFIDNDGCHIYTKGADRISRAWYSILTNHIPFENGSDFWRVLMKRISDFVEQHGGEMCNPKQRETVYRPNYLKIKEMFKSNTPVTSINCK